MSGLREFAAYVLVATPVAGFAFLDPAFGAAAVGGAAAAVLVLFLRIPREAAQEFRVIPLLVAPTAEGPEDVLSAEPPRYSAHLHLATSRLLTVEDGWEEEILS